jgi:uncharacterized protein YjdB
MTSTRALFLGVFLSVLLPCATTVAQDVITVDTVTANSSSVTVPVYIRDASGTSLGMDQPPASRIQAFSISVTYAPASAVSSVTFSRAGITAGLTPTFEVAPAAPGERSLLASFQQSTNPIPFSLDAGAPGDQVARLVFQLDPSAAPGTQISLTLDAATTQLTDEGGSGATKETAANGQLALVNGAIQIPALSLSLTPPTQTLEEGTEGGLTVDVGSSVLANTTVNLSSSDSGVASVPASVVIPAGSRSASVLVTTAAPGSATITATLPGGGSSATAQINVTDAPDCTVPVSPIIGGPESALAGATYTISWPAIAEATSYSIEESTDAGFANATSRTVTTTSTTYSHPTAGARYYYRVRARITAGPCDRVSPASAPISVLITSVPVTVTKYLPVVGSTAGGAGSFFRTSLQLFNPKTTSVSGKLVFHPAGTSGTPNDPSLPYVIAPGKTLTFPDLLPAMGLASGLGSIDLAGDAGSSLPVGVARVFNDGGAAGTTGLALDTLSADDALQAGSNGVLLAPTDIVRFRYNIGIRTLTSGAAMSIVVRDRDGGVRKSLTRSFPATYFQQFSATDFLEGLVLTGSETVSIAMTSGSAFLYGSTTDNLTNDPSAQFARPID